MSTLENIKAEIEKVFCISVITNELRTPMEVKAEILQIIDKYAEQEPCDECKYKTFTELYFHTDPEMVDQEPCDDAISRQAVLDLVNSDWKYEGLETDVASLPSVRPQEQTGKWIKSKDGYMRCDQCGSRGSDIKARFCHHCGAKMFEPRESEDKE